MWIDKDGLHHDLSRRWYSMRATLAIYAEGGHVVLSVNQPTRREQAKAAREALAVKNA